MAAISRNFKTFPARDNARPRIRSGPSVQRLSGAPQHGGMLQL